MKHWQTHLYTYAVMLTQGDAIKPENLAGVRAKALRHGHTPLEVVSVELDPQAYIRTGKTAQAIFSPLGGMQP